jgi:hypothetical protein
MDNIAQWLDDLLIAEFHEAGIYLPGEKEAVERQLMRNRGMVNSGFEAQLLCHQAALQNQATMQRLGNQFSGLFGGGLSGIIPR